jgi:hypothetical protein
MNDIDETTDDDARPSSVKKTGDGSLIKTSKIVFAVDDATVSASTDLALPRRTHGLFWLCYYRGGAYILGDDR